MSKPMRNCATGTALLLGATVTLAMVSGVGAHGPGDAITWNREISRLVYDKCASCHRPGGTAFSLMTFQDVQPRGTAIKEAVLSRRMPPWGAVKGFGSFRNDQSLSEEQIDLFRRWVDGGIRRGNNPRALPTTPTFSAAPTNVSLRNGVRVSGDFVLATSLRLDGVVPEQVPDGRSIRVVAERPDGHVEPLVWLYQYDDRSAHPFLFRSPITLPPGTIIRGVPVDAAISLIPIDD